VLLEVAKVREVLRRELAVPRRLLREAVERRDPVSGRRVSSALEVKRVAFGGAREPP
jgi:hypothetical protein